MKKSQVSLSENTITRDRGRAIWSRSASLPFLVPCPLPPRAQETTGHLQLLWYAVLSDGDPGSTALIRLGSAVVKSHRHSYPFTAEAKAVLRKSEFLQYPPSWTPLMRKETLLLLSKVVKVCYVWHLWMIICIIFSICIFRENYFYNGR